MAKKQRPQNENITISKMTLQAVNNLLFTSNGDGTDYAAVIDDIAGAGTDRDLVKLTVGLLTKGLMPEVAEEDKIRYHAYDYAYEHGSKIKYYRMELVGISHILGTVTYKETAVVAEKLDVLDNGDWTYGAFADTQNTNTCQTTIEAFLYDYETSQEAIEIACRSNSRN